MTLWQQMTRLHLSRRRLAERSGVSIEEISELCAGRKPLAECGGEILAGLAKALKLPAENLPGMAVGAAPYVTVYGEALEALYHEAAQGKDPEELLSKEHLAELFLSAADEFGRDAEKRTHYERWCQEEGGGASLSEFICEKVFQIKRTQDVFQEYRTLQRQIEECQEFLKAKIREFEPLGGKNGPDKHGKAGFLYKTASERSRRLAKCAKPEALVDRALQNVTAGPLNFWRRADFQMEIFRFQELERDQRTVIFFGDLPLQGYRKLMKLAQTDHEAYLDVFETMILSRDIPEQLCRRTEQNVYLHDRTALMKAMVKLFEAEDYQPFVYLLVPQIEGLLRIYQGILSLDAGKEDGAAPWNMKPVTDKIRELEYFLAYSYFTFDFCDELRNPIAHGEIVEIDRERAYEVLTDVWWLAEQIDAPERGYHRWLKIVQDCAAREADAQAIGSLLDAFSGLNQEKNLILLRRHLRNGFEAELAWYGLAEAAKRLDGLLRSQAFYDAIWDGGPARYAEEMMELDRKTVPVQKLENNVEKYRKLAELLHELKAAPADWYARYIRHCEEQNREFDELLESLMSEKEKRAASGPDPAGLPDGT